MAKKITSVALRKATPDEQELATRMEDAARQAEEFGAAAATGIETTHGAVETRPTSTSFTNLAGESVSVEEGDTVWVLDEGRPVRYDPSDGDADGNGYVGVGRRFSLGQVVVDEPETLRSTPQSGLSGAFALGGRGGLFESVASDPYGYGDDGLTALEASDGTWWKRVFPSLDSELQVTVPSDYATLQDAFDAVSRFPPKSDTKIIILIESGHEIGSGPTRSDPAGAKSDAPVALWARNGNYSHIWLQSEDATVPVASGFTGDLIRNIECEGIVLDCLIDMDGAGDWGYSAELQSTGHVTAGSGVINAGTRGLFVRQMSTVYGLGGIDFSGAGDRGCQLNHGSKAYVRGADFSGAGTYGLLAGSTSRVDAEEVDLSGAGEDGLRASDQAIVRVQTATINNCQDRGIHATGACHIHAMSATINGSTGTAVRLERGCYLNASSATINNAGAHGIDALEASYVDAKQINIDNPGLSAIRAQHGSKIGANVGTMTNCGRHSVECHTGATVGLEDVDGSGATEESFAVFDGGIISLKNCTGDTNVTPNAISSDGIIFEN